MKRGSLSLNTTQKGHGSIKNISGIYFVQYNQKKAGEKHNRLTDSVHARAWNSLPKKVLED